MEVKLNELFTAEEKGIIKDSLKDNQRKQNIRIIGVAIVVIVIILLFVGKGRMGYLKKIDISSSFSFVVLISLTIIIPILRRQSIVIKKLYNELKRIKGEDSAKIYIQDCFDPRRKQNRFGMLISLEIIAFLVVLIAAFFLQLDYFGTEEMCTENFIRNMKW